VTIRRKWLPHAGFPYNWGESSRELLRDFPPRENSAIAIGQAEGLSF
jgi:hypothetical protein